MCLLSRFVWQFSVTSIAKSMGYSDADAKSLYGCMSSYLASYLTEVLDNDDACATDKAFMVALGKITETWGGHLSKK